MAELIEGRRVAAALVVATLLVVACSSDLAEPPASSDASSSAAATDGAGIRLPEREGPRRATTGSVPHVQLDAMPVDAVDEELRRRVFLLPGVSNQPSSRSLPGARGLVFDGDLALARRDVLAGNPEFAHIHPDGSLHVFFPIELAEEVDRQKWGELHPWVDRDDFWDGVAMVYTPESFAELEIVIMIVVEAYNFIAGTALDASDIA